MKSKTKTAQKYLSEKDENGSYVYEFGVAKGEFYSSLATKKNKIINSEIVENLNNVANCLAVKDSLTIRIKSHGDENLNISNVHTALQEHYSRQIAKSKVDIARNLNQSLVFFMVGILFFVFYVLLKTHLNANWFEIIDIVSWVFIWEAVDLFFIVRNIQKMEQISYQKIINAKIIVDNVD